MPRKFTEAETVPQKASIGTETIKDSTARVWGASPAGTTFGEGEEPGTRAFFENVLRRRQTYEMPWLDEVVRFADARGKRVLELGCGAGYDAYAFCQAGAEYTGLDITPENPERTKRHLALYGFHPRVLRGDAEQLPFGDASFDLAFSNGVLHHTPDFPRSAREVARVLKPGGEFVVILYHKTSAFYWLTLYLFDYIIDRQYRQGTIDHRLSKIEYTTSDALPLVRVYDRSQLRRILRSAGLDVRSVQVRKLTRDDLPQRYGLPRLWARIPQRMLDFVGRYFGWYIIVRAVKA